MSTISATRTGLPAGTWHVDPVHSSVGFSVKHMVVANFRGGFGTFDVTLDEQGLRGSADVASIDVSEENLNGHLLSPDFFDVERTPRVSFESTSITRDGDELTVEGELEIRGVKQPITLTGTTAGPVKGPAGERIGFTLETVIDRTSFGINWNMELPGGGFILDNEVTLTANLEFGKAQA